MAAKRAAGNLQEDIKNDVNNRDFAKSQELPDADKFEVFSIRLPVNHKQILKQYFKNKGMDLSNGLRMIIYEYMEKHNINKIGF
jgi:hypothetical protein